jgi:hypothetical protein
MMQEDATHNLEATTNQTKPIKSKPNESNKSNQNKPMFFIRSKYKSKSNRGRAGIVNFVQLVNPSSGLDTIKTYRETYDRKAGKQALNTELGGGPQRVPSTN